MNPRMDGTLAAVDAPCRRRLAPRIAEDWTVEHQPPMAKAVGQDSEDRRQDQLGHVEHRGKDPDHPGVDRGTAMVGQVGEVQAEHGPGQAGAEAQGEGPGQDGAQRSFHRVKA